jgi:hypothetical protein
MAKDRKLGLGGLQGAKEISKNENNNKVNTM